MRKLARVWKIHYGPTTALEQLGSDRVQPAIAKLHVQRRRGAQCAENLDAMQSGRQRYRHVAHAVIAVLAGKQLSAIHLALERAEKPGLKLIDVVRLDFNHARHGEGHAGCAAEFGNPVFALHFLHDLRPTVANDDVKARHDQLSGRQLDRRPELAAAHV